jgi:hypothetical protein
MNNFHRREELDTAFSDMHGIKPEVYRENIAYNHYRVKFVYGGKEVIITEIIDRGLTKSVTLEYNGSVESPASVYLAEKRAVEILQGA